MRRLPVLGLVLLLGLAYAHAGENDDDKKAEPPTIADAAEAVLAAVESGDDDALEQLAAATDTDPWLVADALAARGEHDPADRFARAATGPAVAKLPAYLASRRGKEPDRAARAAIAKGNEAWNAEDGKALLAAVSGIDVKDDPLSAIRLQFLLAVARQLLAEYEASSRHWGRAAPAAETLGWLVLAARARDGLGVNAWREDDFPGAARHWLDEIRLYETLGDAQAVSRIRWNLALAHLHAGDAKAAVPHLERAATAWREAGDDRMLAKTLDRTGRAYKVLQQHDRSLAAFEEALAIQTRLGDDAERRWLYGRIGQAHLKRADYAAAVTAYEHALALAEASGDAEAILWALSDLARAHRFPGNHARALPLFERMHEEAEALGDPALLHQARLGLSSALVSVGQLEPARRLVAKEVKRLEGTNDARSLLAALSQLSRVQKALGETDAAFATLERALGAAESAGFEMGRADLLSRMAGLHARRGNLAEGKRLYEEALESARSQEDHFNVSMHMGSIGSILANQGEDARARTLYQEAFAYAEAHGTPRPALVALVGLATLESASGRHTEALRYRRHVLDRARAMGDRDSEAVSLSGIAGDLDAIGDYAGALDHWEQLAKLQQEVGDREGLAKALLQLARYHDALGDRRRALAYAREAHEMLVAIGDPSEVAASLAFQADFARDIANEALLVELALKMYRRLGDLEMSVAAMHRLAGLRFRRGDLEGALRLLEQGIQESLDAGYSNGARPLFTQRAYLRYRRGEYDLALQDYARALEAKILGEDVQDEAWIHEDMARCHSAKGDPDRARRAYEKGLEIAHRHELPSVRRLAGSLGWILLDLGRPQEAVTRFDEALRSVERQRERSRGLTETERSRGFAKLRLSRPFEGMAAAQLALGRVDTTLAYLERGRARGALDLLARSRVDPLGEAEREARENGDEEALARIQEVRKRTMESAAEVRRHHDQLTRLLQRPTGNLAARAAAKERLADARARSEKAQADSLRLARTHLPFTKPAAPDQVKAWLREEERLLYYAVTDGGAWVFVVSPKDAKTRAFTLAWPDGEPVTEEALAEAVHLYLRSLVRDGQRARGFEVDPVDDAPSGTESARVGSRLYDALVPQAIREELLGLERVYVVPHGPLYRIPMEALVLEPHEDAKRRVYWIDRGPPIAYAHSASVLGWCRDRRRSSSAGKRPLEVLALGDPVFQREAAPEAQGTDDDSALAAAETRAAAERAAALVPLPGTRREVEAIAKTVEDPAKVKRLLGEDATKAKLFAAAKDAKWIHLATHHLPDETDRRGYSRLALTLPRVPTPGDDGFLSLYELFQDWRVRLVGSEVVVLSSCETQTGHLQRDEGPFAMPLGFFFAGAPSVIASLWRVADDSTADLMGDFYARLQQEGAGTLEAFTEARRALRKAHPEPFFWAPFVFIGAP